MGLGWADWIRFVLTPLVLGLIAAIVATRNAKKTPHERLKNLVDIHDKMPDHLDSRKVVEAAIARELVDFDRRVAADQRDSGQERRNDSHNSAQLSRYLLDLRYS